MVPATATAEEAVTKTADKKGPPPITLTRDQAEAVDRILDFWKDQEDYLTFGGFAGTGKTTTIVEVVRRLGQLKPKKGETTGGRPLIAFCAFTGRAASVLRGKLEAAGVMEIGDYCGTIHSMIYKPRTENGRIVGWEKTPEIPYELIIVDEASMLTETIWTDLRSFERPILAVGDHGQLPPVGDSFNLMADPVVRLETINRQAAGDPIIKLSMMVREGGTIPVGRYGEFVSKTSDRNVLDKIPDVSDPLILCGLNKTRSAMNRYVRRRLGLTSPIPQVGERVICLKNNRNAGIYNGMVGALEAVNEDGKNHLVIKARMDGGVVFDGRVWRAQFGADYTVKPKDKFHAKEVGDLFDWGYAMTVHKSQGSEAKRVVIFEERLPKMTDEEWRRWLYTGVTRARERLLVVGD